MKTTTLEFYNDDARYFKELKFNSKIIKNMPELMNLITIHIKEAIAKGDLKIE